jgi:hypothetical protein
VISFREARKNKKQQHVWGRGHRPEKEKQLKLNVAGCWGLTPVILVTPEADIRRIEIQGQLR